MTQVTFTVFFIPDITCGHCERVIAKVLSSVDGVQRVAVDASTRRAWVDYDPLRVEVARLTAILTQAGYPVAGIAVADDQPATTG